MARRKERSDDVEPARRVALVGGGFGLRDLCPRRRAPEVDCVEIEPANAQAHHMLGALDLQARGAADAAARIADMSVRCSQTTLVLGGFSQGAAAVSMLAGVPPVGDRVGIPWLHAAPFHYCGSIGPIKPSPSLQGQLEKLGSVLAQGCGLKGLFGVDYIRREETPWIVEINPRLTTSYIGYRQLCEDNLMERLLFPERFSEPLQWCDGMVSFDSDGVCRYAAAEARL